MSKNTSTEHPTSREERLNFSDKDIKFKDETTVAEPRVVFEQTTHAIKHMTQQYDRLRPTDEKMRKTFGLFKYTK